MESYPDEEADALDSESAPLLAHADEDVAQLEHKIFRDPARLLNFTCFRALPWIVVLLCLQTVTLHAEQSLQFPYLRSLQRCGRLAPEIHPYHQDFYTRVAPHYQREWSGSTIAATRAW